MKKKIFIVIVLAILFIPFCLHILIKPNLASKYLTTENRTVTQLPTIDNLRHPKIFFKDYSLFVTDRLWGKDTITRHVNNLIKDPNFFTSFDLSKGVIGANGYVFLGNDYADVIDRHFRVFSFKKHSDYAETLFEKITTLSKLSHEFKSQFIVLIAPDKHTVYEEFFPSWVKQKPSELTLTQLGISDLKKNGIPVLFPSNDLISQTETEQVYFKTDTHWNIKGAEVAFRSILKALKLEEPKNTFLIVPDGVSKNIGDLGPIVGIPSNFSFEDKSYRFNFGEDQVVTWVEPMQEQKEIMIKDALARGFQKTFSAKVKNNHSQSTKSIMLICDSFGTSLSPFLSSYFRTVYLTSNHKSLTVLSDEIKENKPDIVIYEIVERSFIMPGSNDRNKDKSKNRLKQVS